MAASDAVNTSNTVSECSSARAAEVISSSGSTFNGSVNNNSKLPEGKQMAGKSMAGKLSAGATVASHPDVVV
jgi:hypothetical protein